MAKFHGELEDLQRAVEGTGRTGTWEDGKGQHCFRAKTGEVLTWWPSKGTLLIQGQNKEDFEAALMTLLGSPLPEKA